MKKAFLVVSLFAVLLSGCVVEVKGLETRDFPYEMMLQQTDLSDQYIFLDNEFPDVENGQAYKVAYKNINNFTGSFISHQVAIFQDASSAENYYQILEDHFLRNYSLPEGLTFSPANTTDIYKIGCIDGSTNGIPTWTCRLNQIHGNIVIRVITNINTMGLDMKTFNEILQILDSRLPVSENLTPTP